MNPLSRLFFVGCLLLTSAPVFATSAFEGTVSLAITNAKGGSHAMDYTMKGRKLRLDVNTEGHSMSTIMDMEKMEMLILIPQQSMYMVMPIKQAVDRAREHAEEHGADVDVERTGKTEKILGYACDQILVTDKAKGTVTELWVAPDLGMFMGLGGGNPMGGGGMFGGHKSSSPVAAKWEEVMKGKGGFPLRVISHDAGGKETFRMEATKIAPGNEPDSLFAPPDDYRQLQMPNLGGMNPFNRQ